MKAEPWIFDFPYGEGRQIELPFNDYSVICFNNDADGIIWENPESYSRFSASTKIVETPDGNRACLTPPWLCGDHIGLVSIRNTESEDGGKPLHFRGERHPETGTCDCHQGEPIGNVGEESYGRNAGEESFG